MTTRYTLISGIAINAQYPDTFHVPTDEQRRAVRIGDYVQLMFSGHGGAAVERMWVTVTSVDYPHYRGTLENQPCEPDAFGLTHGDPVAFHARHIVNRQAAA